MGAKDMSTPCEDGYVTELTTDSGGVQRVHQYSLFNKAPDVIEPPADRVLAPLPTAPKCTAGEATAVEFHLPRLVVASAV